eukprot:351962-Chlamydomonas_euryale.AAC.5
MDERFTHARVQICTPLTALNNTPARCSPAWHVQPCTAFEAPHIVCSPARRLLPYIASEALRGV